MAGEVEWDPRHCNQKMQTRRQEIIDHLRQDSGKVDRPQLKAMFATAAEIRGGRKTALSDDETKCEKAWQR